MNSSNGQSAVLRRAKFRRCTKYKAVVTESFFLLDESEGALAVLRTCMTERCTAIVMCCKGLKGTFEMLQFTEVYMSGQSKMFCRRGCIVGIKNSWFTQMNNSVVQNLLYLEMD